jgi:hypothetical protein
MSLLQPPAHDPIANASAAAVPFPLLMVPVVLRPHAAVGAAVKPARQLPVMLLVLLLPPPGSRLLRLAAGASVPAPATAVAPCWFDRCWRWYLSMSSLLASRLLQKDSMKERATQGELFPCLGPWEGPQMLLLLRLLVLFSCCWWSLPCDCHSCNPFACCCSGVGCPSQYSSRALYLQLLQPPLFPS